MPQRMPQVARCEDYDSDNSSVKPGTRKEARRRATTNTRPPKTLDRYRTAARDGASDSGYSSHTSGTQASNNSATVQAAATAQRLPAQAPARPATAQGTRSRPIIHASDNQRSKDKAPAPPSPSKTRETVQCDGYSCQHPGCVAWRNRRYSLSQQQAAQYAAQYAAATPTQYQATTPGYQYQQYAQVPTNQAVPTLSAQPRPRSGSASRSARPVSFHGYSVPNMYGNGQQGGPPPSASAYQNMQYAAWAQAYQQQQQQQQAYQQATAYGTTPPTQTMFYPHQSPSATSPTSPNHTRAPSLTRTYSARTANPPSEAPKQQYPSTALNRTYSARQANPRTSTMPGAFPDPESSESMSSSEDSSSEYSEDEYERDHRSRARDSKFMPSTSSSQQRRPSIRRQYATAPVVPTRSSRELLQRNPRSEATLGLDYISSSDNMDSDRTARAVVDRPRTNYTGSSKSSRRPSVSTTASSGRTKSTAISSTSGAANMVFEGRNGRNVTYLSKRDQARHQARLEEYTRQQFENQRLQDVEAYQDAVRGGPAPALTAENIRKKELRTSGSHMSVHSRKSSRSSSKVPNPDGIKIESNGTVIHVYGDTKVEMRAVENGTSLVIGTSSGRDSTYHSNSKSSGSRTGRSGGGSDIGSRRRDVIREDDVYERAAGEPNTAGQF